MMDQKTPFLLGSTIFCLLFTIQAGAFGGTGPYQCTLSCLKVNYTQRTPRSIQIDETPFTINKSTKKGAQAEFLRLAEINCEQETKKPLSTSKTTQLILKKGHQDNATLIQLMRDGKKKPNSFRLRTGRKRQVQDWFHESCKEIRNEQYAEAADSHS